MERMIESLKSGKIRTIEINQSEKKYEYVARCLRDISEIDKFHYRDKNSLKRDHCYFGCTIAKKPIYLFLDNGRNKIVVCNAISHEVSYIPESDYEVVKKILLNSKSATRYMKRNEIIKAAHKVIWVYLLVMCIILLLAYCFKIFDDGRFGTIALNIMAVMGLQDCINIFLLRFQIKHYDKFAFFLELFEIIVLLTGLAAFLVPGAYDKIGRYNNMVGIVLTMGTLLVKFDRPRGNP